MKRILLFVITGMLIFGFSAVSMAAATFGGEITVGIQGWQQTASGSTTLIPQEELGNTSGYANDYVFGKMVLNGKLGADLTGTLALKGDPVSIGAVWDEASLTFTEDWGTLKFGFFGWNNNLKDILDVWTDDIKSQTTVAFNTKLTDNISFGMAFAYTGNGYGTVHDPWINDGSLYVVGAGNQDYDYSTSAHATGQDLNKAAAYKNAFGGDLGFTSGIVGGDLLYYHYNDNDSAWGINASIQLGDFKPFIEYRNFQSNAYSDYTTEPYNLVNSIVGIIYESANSPFYARAEVDLNGKGFFASSFFTEYFLDQFNQEHINDTLYYFNSNYTYKGNPWGIRLGYKLMNGSKIEAQYFHTGFDSHQLGGSDYASYSVPQNKYYLKLISAF